MLDASELWLPGLNSIYDGQHINIALNWIEFYYQSTHV